MLWVDDKGSRRSCRAGERMNAIVRWTATIACTGLAMTAAGCGGSATTATTATTMPAAEILTMAGSLDQFSSHVLAHAVVRAAADGPRYRSRAQAMSRSASLAGWELMTLPAALVWNANRPLLSCR